MFSGLGSIADLNQSFAQFTSNLTNLDTLQQDGSAARAQGDEKKAAAPAQGDTTIDQLNEYKAMYESALESLSTANSEVEVGRSTIAALEQEVAEVRNYLSVTTTTFEEYKSETEERIRQLIEKQAAKSTPRKAAAGTEDTGVAERFALKIKDLEEKLELSERSNTALRGNVSELNARTEDTGVADRLALKIQELEEKLELSERGNTALRSDVSELNAKLAACAAELQGSADSHNLAVQRLESEVKTYVDNVVQLNEEKEQLQTQVQSLQRRLQVTEAQLQDVCQSAAQSGEAVQSTQSVVQELQTALTRAQQSNIDSEGKVATLTEKLKDMMHRFAELKSKSGAQLQQEQEKYADLLKIAQAKVQCHISS
jgi:chromosome segregation ATPase